MSPAGMKFHAFPLGGLYMTNRHAPDIKFIPVWDFMPAWNSLSRYEFHAGMSHVRSYVKAALLLLSYLTQGQPLLTTHHTHAWPTTAPWEECDVIEDVVSLQTSSRRVPEERGRCADRGRSLLMGILAWSVFKGSQIVGYENFLNFLYRFRPEIFKKSWKLIDLSLLTFA